MTKKEFSETRNAADNALERLRDLMQEHFDDQSPDWQKGDDGDNFREKIEAIEEALEIVGRL